MRTLLISLALHLCALAPLGATERTDFLTSYCIDCHDADSKKGNLDIDALQKVPINTDNLSHWIHLHDRVATSEMPPKKKTQPDDRSRSSFLASLRSSISQAETQRPIATARRMNRGEFESALRDLLHLPNLRIQDLLPEDGQQDGFDKVGGALDFSNILVSKYMQAAEFALRMAATTAPERPDTRTWRELASRQDTARAAIAVHCAVPLRGHELAPGLTTHIVGNPEKDIGNTYRAAKFAGEAESVALLTGVIGAHQPEGLQIDRFRPTVSGWYRVRFSAWSLRWMRDHVEASRRGVIRNFTSHGPPYFREGDGPWQYTRLTEAKVDAGRTENVEFYGDGEATHVIRASLKGQPLGFFDASSLKPVTHEFKVWLDPNDRVSFHAMTLPAVGARNSGSNEGVLDYEGPSIAFDWFEVEGPLFDQWPPKSHRTLFGEGGEDYRILLKRFASTAFRRPLIDGELARYESLVESSLSTGTPITEALLTGYQAILCSPDFLVIGLEPREHALASRLSFFLWNAPPDEVLLQLAANHTLSKPETLKAQVARMLADPKSERFIHHFLDEWLELRKIDFTTPDKTLYPEYDPYLHDSMLAETRRSFRRLIDKNISVRALVSDDTVLVNQRLAELYGIRGVIGSPFREVQLPPGSPRGGFLTQASILKVTANGTATSPVLRGAWVIERILGVPRQPPPPDVPAIEPDATGAVTIRQMIEKHRADAACATCHAKIDPPGLALENFDVIGGWRDQYRIAGQPKKVRVGTGKDAKMIDEPSIEIISETSQRNRSKIRLGASVDPSGNMADGRDFKNISDFRRLLLENEDALARNVVRQLLTYSTGHAPRFSDRPAIESILSKTKPSKHGLRSLLEQVIMSPLFIRQLDNPPTTSK